MRTIRWSHTALKQFMALPTTAQAAIEAKLDLLAAQPSALANQVKALKGVAAFRLRVGTYRVIFKDADTILTVLAVGHRKNVYD